MPPRHSNLPFWTAGVVLSVLLLPSWSFARYYTRPLPGLRAGQLIGAPEPSDMAHQFQECDAGFPFLLFDGLNRNLLERPWLFWWTMQTFQSAGKPGFLYQS